MVTIKLAKLHTLERISYLIGKSPLTSVEISAANIYQRQLSTLLWIEIQIGKTRAA
jgi:hypothetical protein